ncbi:AMP-binding protein [Brevibacterium luteolum]|uniref:class I adenylate-forming enzyme family protein n=1 Tax=Brevibacterium luteolum TaxID=199591 RepID=UPI001C229B0C|nr:AMP-binding protein [Brevibacterium luteolum]
MSVNDSKMHEKSTITEAARFIHGPALSEALAQLAADDPQRIYLRTRDRSLTVAELNDRVDAAVEALRRHGIDSESRVALAADVGIDHVTLIFALLRLGALWVPTNTQLRGEPLRHHLGDSGATVLIVQRPSILLENVPETIATKDLGLPDRAGPELVLVSPQSLLSENLVPAAGDRGDACVLMYTSGTTGPPKGALVSETMLRAAVLGTLEVTEPRTGDVFYVWEPLFHIGGAQVVFVPLFCDTTLALVPKFSASRFWRDIVDFDVTHIHYLGGVLQILLQLPPVPEERDNRVRIAWGAGATPEVRKACHSRYAFALHECYGMTEVSSVVTVNRNDPEGGVGALFPWVEIAIDSSHRDASDRDSSHLGAVEGGRFSLPGDPPLPGEILVKGRVDGILTAGYLGNAEATEKARDGQWFRTGDFGRLDEKGNLHFEGRGSDSIRVRGENVSAWQVESIFGLHPHVDRCAVIGVDAKVGEQEMMLIVTEGEGQVLSPKSLIDWGRGRLAKFQVPRYIKIVSEMPLTPSQRIAKHRLPKDLEGAFDVSS